MDAGGLAGGRDLPLLWRAWRQGLVDFVREVAVANRVELRTVGEREAVGDARGSLGKVAVFGYGPEGDATVRAALGRLSRAEVEDVAESLLAGLPKVLAMAPDVGAKDGAEAEALRGVWWRYSAGLAGALPTGEWVPPGRRVMAGRSVGFGLATGPVGDAGDTVLGDLLRWCLDVEQLDSGAGIDALVGQVTAGGVGRKSDAMVGAWFRAMVEMGEGWKVREGRGAARLDGEWSARWLRHAWGIVRTGRTVRDAARAPWGPEHAAMADAMVEWFLARGVLMPGEWERDAAGKVAAAGPGPWLSGTVFVREEGDATVENLGRALRHVMGEFGMRPRGRAFDLARAACERRLARWRASRAR